MESIFISHSREDSNLEFMKRAFTGCEADAVMMEFEEYENPPASAIREKVEQAKAVFVLLSTQILGRGRVTSNWISFEVGLAYALGKPVWLFESIREPFLGEYNFPIPYCTHHVVYDPCDSSAKNMDVMQSIIEGPPYPQISPIQVRCPGCELSYFAVGITHRFDSTDCPNCKRAFVFGDTDDGGFDKSDLH